MSFEKFIWTHFSSLVLSMNKMFFISYIIPQLELTWDNIVLNYSLLPVLPMQKTISSESPACVKEHHCTIKPMSWKNSSTSTVRRRLCEASLYSRIAVKKSKLRKPINVKRLQWVKGRKDWTIERWDKVLWTNESKFRIFGSNMRVYVRQIIGERAATPCITSTVKGGGWSFMV